MYGQGKLWFVCRGIFSRLYSYLSAPFRQAPEPAAEEENQGEAGAQVNIGVHVYAFCTLKPAFEDHLIKCGMGAVFTG